MSQKPDFKINKTATTVTGEIFNRNGRTTTVHRADGQNQEPQLILTITEDTFTDTDVPVRASYYLRFRELDLSINITEDNSDQTPPWFLAEPVGDTTFTASSFSFNPSWSGAVTVQSIVVDNLQFGTKSRRDYTK